MKVENRTAKVVENIQFQDEVVVGIEESELGSLIESLTHIYKDPYEANLREYSCNALDATILAGSDRAVEITLPSVLSPTLLIRDYGVGMTKEEFVQVFSKIGSSTKRETNSQIGAFGIGSKSAFAIVSQFIVTSVKNGYKNTIIVSKNEDRVPVLKFLTEVETDELSGTTVSMAVPDVNRMSKAADGLFLGWKPGTILVNGATVGGDLWKDYRYTEYKNGWFAKAKNYPSSWSNNNYGNQLEGYTVTAVLGPVRYPVSVANIFDQNNKEDVEYIKKIKNIVNRLVLNVEVGSVSVVRSRDSFLFDKRTKAHLRSLFTGLIKEIQDTYKDSAEKASTRAEAIQLATQLEEEACFSLNLTWRGELIPLANQSESLHSKILGKGQHYFISKRGNNPWKTDYHLFNGKNKKVVLVTDVEEKDAKWGEYNWTIPTWRAIARETFYNDLLDSDKTLTLILLKTPKGQVSPWAETLADEIISFPDLIAQGTEARRQRDRIARANRGTVVQKNRESVTVRELTQNIYRNTFSYHRSEVNSDKLTQEKIVYIASPKEATTPEDVTAQNAYDHFMLRKAPELWHFTPDERALYFVAAYLVAEEYKLVLVPRAVDIDKFNAAVPQAISWAKAIDIVHSEINNIDPQLEGYLAISNTSIDTVKKLNTEDIVDEETRGFFESIAGNKMKKFSVVHTIVTHISYPTQQKPVLYKGIASAVETLGKGKNSDATFTFPLLSCLSHDAKTEHVVDYINLLSAARKA